MERKGGQKVQMDRISRIKAFSFFVSTCQKHYKKEFPDKRPTFVEFSKCCGERWRELSESQKFKFHVLAEKERKSNASDEEDGEDKKKHSPIVLSDDDDEASTSSGKPTVRKKKANRGGSASGSGNERKSRGESVKSNRLLRKSAVRSQLRQSSLPERTASRVRPQAEADKRQCGGSAGKRRKKESSR